MGRKITALFVSLAMLCILFAGCAAEAPAADPTVLESASEGDYEYDVY